MLEVGLSVVGSVAFGRWQQNVWAGVFMFIVLFMAACAVDAVAMRTKK
jgi:hypothetical protein